MIADGTLFEIAEHIHRNSERTEIIAELSSILEDIYNLEEYQDWLKEGQYFEKNSPTSRFQLPFTFGEKYSSKKRSLLESYSLISGNVLTTKIDMHAGQLHITDGSWVPTHRRVFSFTDESQLLLQWAQKLEFVGKIEMLIDPASGCGHHAMGFNDIPIKICTDINARALAYCSVNAALSRDKSRFMSPYNIVDGIHPVAKKISSSHTLILINMPFAIFPHGPVGNRKNAQDGGENGFELTRHAIDAVVDFIENSESENVSAGILCYSMGHEGKNSWEAQNYFDSLGTNLQGKYDILHNEKLWRVNGKKEQDNPMNTSLIHLKGRCSHSYNSNEFEWATEGYKKIELELKKDGYDHLSYGILEISN